MPHLSEAKSVDRLLSPKRILVPVKGSSLDEDTMQLACEMARRVHARLYVVSVIEVKRSLPLETELPGEIQRGEEVLARAEAVARKWKQEIEAEVLQARDAGTAIVEEAERQNVDLIILGLSYKKKYDQFCLGDTVMHVLRNAPGRVLVHREPIPYPDGSGGERPGGR